MSKTFFFNCPSLPGPLQGVPDGAKVKIKFRPGEFVYAYVRTANDITQYAVIEGPDGMPILGPRITRNERL